MKRILIFALIFSMITGMSAAAEGDVLAGIYADTPEPQVASIGGEWAVIALARAGYCVPAGYYESYAAKAEDFIKSGAARKYTDYARVLLALTAIGADTYGAEEYLDDYDAVTSQGINGAAYALIALGSGGYESGECGNYIDFILERQHSDGGFGLSDVSDIDVTAMVLQALANYSDRTDVSAAIDNAFKYLENAEISSSESAAQCVIACCALKRNYEKYYDELMKYQVNGRFSHVLGGQVNQMSTEQGALAVVAAGRRTGGTTWIYDMSDVYSHSVDIKSEMTAVCVKGIAEVMVRGFAVTGVLWRR